MMDCSSTIVGIRQSQWLAKHTEFPSELVFRLRVAKKSLYSAPSGDVRVALEPYRLFQQCGPGAAHVPSFISHISPVLLSVTVPSPLAVYRGSVDWHTQLPLCSTAMSPSTVQVMKPAPAAPVAPAGPVGPAGPVAPVAPIVPAVPAGPAGPVAPVSPVAPLAPVAPVAPAAPVVPVKPCGPCGPTGPMTRDPVPSCPVMVSTTTGRAEVSPVRFVLMPAK